MILADYWRFGRMQYKYLASKTFNEKVDNIVWFLKNQTTFEATSGGWLRSMISHFYGLRLVHLGMPHSASFLPQNSPVMSFGTYAFKGFLPLLPIFCHLFTAERLQLLCCSTPKKIHIESIEEGQIVCGLAIRLLAWGPRSSALIW